MVRQGGVVGRAGDLARVTTVLDRALAEEPGVVLVLGEAGVGKTTVLRATVQLAADRGFVTAVGSCAEGASGTSFGPFRAALRALVPAYGEAAVAAAIDVAPAAATLLPASVRPARPVDASPDAGELYDALLEVVGTLAGRDPLLLAIEDLHWADRSTLELLSFLVRNLDAERVVIVATARTEDLALDGPTGRTMTELARLGATARVDLVGLDRTELGELVAVEGLSLDDDEVTTLHARTGGNPFFALELLEAGAAVAGPLPRSVTDTIEIRLGTLDPVTLLTVRTAAVAGPVVDTEVLTEVLDRSAAEVEAAVHEASAIGVLTPDPATGEVWFRHALVREVAYGGLLTSERRRLHQQVAASLSTRPDADAALLAHHYAAANRPADALRTSIVAARAAAGAYGSADAVAHYLRAVEVWNVVKPADRPDEPKLPDLLQEAMVCALNVGAVQEGSELGARLLDTLDPTVDPERWALDAARQAELRWEQADMAGATDLLDRATRYLEGRADSVARVRVLERRSFQAVVTGRGEKGWELAARAIEIAEGLDDPEALTLARTRGALAASAAGRRDGQARLVESFETAWAARLPHELNRAATNLLLLLHAGCKLDAALEVGPRVLEAAAELHLGPSSLVALRALYARSLVDTGNWDRADELLSGIHLPNAARLRTYVAIAVAELAVARGDGGLARRMLDESRFEFVATLALRQGALEAELALVDGAPNLARAHVDRQLPLAELIVDASYVRLCALALASLPRWDAELADGYRDGALRRAAQFDDVPAGAPGDVRAWLAVVDATYAAVIGEPSRAAWLDAVERFGTVGLVVRRAWAQVGAARAILEEGGDRDEATALLADAHALAHRLGAQPIQRAAEQLARRARLDVPGIARLADGELGLTDRETEVLRLVAAGRTNREIAAELFISAKTASVHVSNILRKVGATTRGEAAAIAHQRGLAG